MERRRGTHNNLPWFVFGNLCCCSVDGARNVGRKIVVHNDGNVQVRNISKLLG
jgi:hypothetical protein